MKEKLIILGAGVMQGPVINIAKELGYYAIALDGSSAAPCISLADQFEQIDLKDKEGIETFARSIQGTTNRLGIMTAGTDFSANVAWVAEKLELPGIPYEAALNASDKSRMRECFKKASLPSPDFITITAADLPLSPHSPLSTPNYPLSTIHYPLVIKPVDNMGSRGCRRVDIIEELNEAAKTAIGFSRSGRAILENYMEGPEFSVDAIVYHGEITICGLADRHIFFPPYFIEMGHTMPTNIKEEKQTAILDTFRAGIHALGLDGQESIGAAKGDIKFTAKGPMIGEIAARLSGGYMSGWTYPYSSGALPIKGAILAAMGRKPEGLTPTKKWTCAERAFISIPGTVKQIKGVENAKNTKYVNDFFLRIEKGSKVSFPENNVTKCGNVIASAENRETAIQAAETAARSVLIRLDPADMETKAFLSSTAVFPPDAFQLTDDQKTALSQLPDFPTPQSGNAPQIYPFPAFTSSTLRDYMGRNVEEVLNIVRLLTGFPLPVSSENAENIVILGRSFWSALIRGSYQGAVYYVDNLGAKIDSKPLEKI
ncbi:ATP-grasp domain-containing protein [Treponema sp. R6D11]